MLSPRNYQREGIGFLNRSKRAMLCDDPGLGKTLQAAIAAVEPVMVACPTYLVDQWATFVRQQYPYMTVRVAQGNRAERSAELTESADWYIVNTEMFAERRKPKSKVKLTYNLPKCNTLIVDESHHIRNRTASQSRGIAKYAKDIPNVYLLTATPIVKDPDDLWHQLHVVDPKEFSSYNDFVGRYLKFVETPWGIKIVGIRDVEGLKKTLEKYMLRRTYAQVRLELPDTITNIIRVDMPEDMRKRYKQLKDEYRLDEKVYDNAVAVIQRLRQMTFCEEKFAAAANLLVDVHKGAVIFTWYKRQAEILGKVVGAPVITGDLPPNERAVLAKSSDMVVATLASLSEGVDLSHLKNVFFFEMDYTAGVMHQALSRVVRWSHNIEPVRVYYIMMKGTVDETIYNCVQRRVTNARAVLREEFVNTDD